MNKEIDFSPQWRMLSARHDYLKSCLADEVELLDHLQHCVGPNLRCAYMNSIGQYEYRIFMLELAVRKWRRRFAMRQAAINNGTVPDYVKIEEKIERELEQYQEVLQKRNEEIERTIVQNNMSCMTEEESTGLRMMYLSAVKRLHPDLTPSLSTDQIELWHKIQRAHNEQDWESLRYYVSLVDKIQIGYRVVLQESSIKELKHSIERIEKSLNDIRVRRSELETMEPFCWRELLADKDRITTRQAELMEHENDLEKECTYYENKWKETVK